MKRFIKSTPAFPVIDIAKAIEFYESKMGFKARHREPAFAILIRDGIEIHLWAACDRGWKFRSLFLFLKPVLSGAETFLAGTVSCRIEVLGIDEIYQEYKAQGILHSEHTTIEEQYWGHRDFPVLDLYGNLITFYQVMD